MKLLITKILSIALLLAVFAVPLLTAPTYAAAKDDICTGLADTTGTSCGTTGAGSDTVNKTLRLVINLFSLLVGVAAVIMIIVGGLKYVMSSGDSNNVSSAKNTILYAAVGLVIAALAQVIVRFVLKKTVT